MILVMIRLLSIFFLLPLIGVSQEIAITFDDAPTGSGPLFSGVERSQRIVDALKKEKVNEVAFFVLTNGIGYDNQDRLTFYTQSGHLLANHSHTHQWMHQIGTSAYIRDVAIADSILGSYPRYMKWFRYPFLDEGRTIAARDSLRTALKGLGLTNGYVTVDNYDWYINALLRRATDEKKNVDLEILRDIYIDHIYQSVTFYDGIARKNLGRSPRHVLLLHENDLAALFLRDLIAHLKKNGWKIISPREAYQDPIASTVPDVLFNGQGRIAAIVRAKGIAARELVQISEDEEYLENLVKEKKVFK